MTMIKIPSLNWTNEKVLIIGTGESLTDDQVSIINNLSYKKIAVNDAIYKIENPDIHYACDRKWWDFHYKTLPDYEKTIRVSLEQTKYPEIYTVGNRGAHPGFCDEYGYVHDGRNSSFQACNLAYHYGCKTFILCGVDMGGTHFFGPHPQALRNTKNFTRMIELFETLTENSDIEIINCSPISKLTFFRYEDIRCV